MTENEQFLLGKLNGTVDAIKETVDNLVDEVRKLPCSHHETVINELTVWKDNCKSNSTEKLKGNISLRNGLIIGCVTFISGVTMAVITNLLIR